MRRMLRVTRTTQEAEAQEQVEGLRLSRAAPVERLVHFRSLMGLDAPVPEFGAAVPIVAYDPKPSGEGGVFLIDEERQELDASHSARDWQVTAAFTETLASLSHYIPTLDVRVSPIVTMAFGGQHVGPALNAIARPQCRAWPHMRERWVPINAGIRITHTRQTSQRAKSCTSTN